MYCTNWQCLPINIFNNIQHDVTKCQCLTHTHTHIVTLSLSASSLRPLKSSNKEFSSQPTFLLWLFILRYGWATKDKDEHKMGWQLNMTLSLSLDSSRPQGRGTADRPTHDKQHIYTVYWWQFITRWMLVVWAQKISDNGSWPNYDMAHSPRIIHRTFALWELTIPYTIGIHIL